MCWFLLPYVALSHSTWGAWDVSSTNILDLHPSISHKILCCTPIVPPPCQSWACKRKWTKMLNGNIWCWNWLIFMGMKYMSRKVSEIQTPRFLSLLETHKLAKKKKIKNSKGPDQTTPPRFSSNPALGGTFSLNLSSRHQPRGCWCGWCHHRLQALHTQVLRALSEGSSATLSPPLTAADLLSRDNTGMNFTPGSISAPHPTLHTQP